MAIANNAHAAVVLLLEKGADITVVNISGATVLHQAAHTGDAELMALLSKHSLTGLDWDAKNAQGETATDVFNKARRYNDEAEGGVFNPGGHRPRH
jgi:ankyrin repeat protein